MNKLYKTTALVLTLTGLSLGPQLIASAQEQEPQESNHFLDYHNHLMGDAAVEALAKKVASDKEITILDLGGNNFGDIGEKALKNAGFENLKDANKKKSGIWARKK